MRKARIAVLVTGGGTNLQALIDAQAAGRIPSGEIALVVSNRGDAYALQRAAGAGIPTRTVTKADYPASAERAAALNAALAEFQIDMVVLAGYLGIIKSETIRHYSNRIINIHPALIPSFCGMGFYGLHVHEAALKRGVKITGATVHLVTEDVDGGPILLQKAVEVQDGDTPEVLQRRVMEQAEWLILPQATEMIAEKIAKEL